MKNKILIGGTLLMLAAMSSPGADIATGDPGSRGDLNDLYRASELSVDGFGTMSLGKYTLDHPSNARVRHNARLGVGAGLNYFITRNLGIGAEAYADDEVGALIDSGSVNLILRLPLDQGGLAPYVFGGFGRQFDLSSVWFAQGGTGVEYRFNPQVGVFADARLVLPNETKYYGVARLGFRFAF